MNQNEQMREAFERFRDQRNKEVELHGHKPISMWHVTNAHWPTWQAAQQALAHVNETPKNEHDKGDVLNKSGYVDIMREALTVSHNAMKYLMHWDELRDFIVPYRVRDPSRSAMATIELTLAAEPEPLVRLTDDELNEIAGQAKQKWLDGQPDAFLITTLAKAIMDAMIAKNGGGK